MKILWSPRAKKDLSNIADFIAHDKKRAALKWLQSIKKKVSRLQKFPYSGPVVPEIKRSEIREIIFGNYRIIYKVDATVSILTVFNGAKLLTNELIPGTHD